MAAATSEPKKSAEETARRLDALARIGRVAEAVAARTPREGRPAPEDIVRTGRENWDADQPTA